MTAAQQKHLEFVLGYCVDRLNAAPDDPAVADVANKLAALKAYAQEINVAGAGVTFARWLVENYGFENGQPIKHTPPKFVRPSRFFKVVAYEQWVEQRRAEYDQLGLESA